MKRTYQLICLLLVWLNPLTIYASHIVGGELSYKYISGNIYQLKLKVYRDCNSNVQFDDPTTITIFNSTGSVVTTVPINFPGATTIPNNTGNICLNVPPNICVQEAVFIANVTLPPITGGYILVYQRCCRNSTAVNITNPGTTGASFVATIPDPVVATNNSSPIFTNFPPTCICVNQPLVFDHSATDIDGDQLVYSLFNPFAGASSSNPTPVPANAPPFPLVSYVSGYSATYPVSSSPVISINSTTGLLTGTPDAIGQFIVGVCVKEYRSGVLVSTHYRDFQFNVVQCLQNVTASIPTNLSACKNSAYTFINNSVGGTYYHWDFGVSGTNADTSNLFSPTYTYTNSGTYTVTLTVNPGYSCAATTTATITVYPIPTGTPSNNGPVCVGSQINLFAVTVAGATYSWTGPNGFSSSQQNPVINNATLVNAGTYHLAVTANGCTNINASNTNVVVHPIPSPPVISSNSPICVGATLNLSAVTVNGSTYSWTGPNGWTSNLQNPAINVTVAANAGTYYCTSTINSCTSAPDSITVVLFPSPTALQPTNNAPFCSGNTLNLSTGTVSGASYSWTGPLGFSSSLQNPSVPNATDANSGNYSLTINVNGCNSLPLTTNVVIYPTPNSIASSNSPACDGLPLHLYATTIAGGSYSWTGPGGFTSNTQNPTINIVSMASAGIYTVTATANGCIGNPSNTTVVVNPIPAVPVVSNNAPMCSGQTLNLVAQNVTGGTFNWTGPNGFNSTQQNPVITNVPFANSGTYNATVTVLGCTSLPAATNAVINLSPLGTPVNNGPLCDGQTLNLSTTPISGSTYSWMGPNGFTSTQQNPSINNVTVANNAGSYSLTMSLAGCVGNTVSTNVVIHPIPTAPVLSSNTPICAGQSLQLHITNYMNGTFAWNGPNSFTSSLRDPVIANATTAASGIYNATVSLFNCLSPSSSVTVLVKPVPAAPGATSNSPLCAGQTITLNAGNVAGGSYSWTGPASFISSVQNPSIVNSTTNNSGNYSVTASVNGCASSASVVNVIVYPIPSSSFYLAASVCAGNNTNINYTGMSSATASYNWNFGGGTVNSGTGQGPYSVDWANAGTKSVSLVVTENGCTSPTTTHSIIVYPIPTSTFNLPAAICQSDSALIGYTGSASATAIYSWDFDSGIILSGNGAGPYQIKYASAGTYTITLSVAENGCTSTVTSQTIIVNPVPTADFTVTPAVICPGQDAVITYNGTGSSGAAFQWSFGNGTITTGTGIGPYSVNYLNPGMDTVTLIVTENNCTSSQVTQILLVDSLPQVAFSVTDTLGCNPFSTTFFNESTRTQSVFWNFGDDGTSTEENPTHVYPPGLFSVKLVVTSASGCVDSISKPDLISVLNNPIAKFSAKPETGIVTEVKDATFYFTNQSVYANSYKWFFGDGDSSTLQNPIHVYQDSGNYDVMLIAYDSIGCTDTFLLGKFVVIANINYFIPTAFTPNNDGVNDIFYVYGRSLKNVHLMVYDRIGEKVFESNGIYEGWDGTFRHSGMNTGVYVYYAEVETMKGDVIVLKGDVTLIR